MQKALLIAEKPSLMRDIKNAYDHIANKVNYDITFISQVGHLVELLDPVEVNPVYKKWDVDLLPINPEKEGGWQYKVSRKTKDVYKNIETEIKSNKYDVIINAGDPDQEGELLINLVLNKIGNKLPVLRLWSNDTTQVALENALQNLQDDNEKRFRNLYHAALLRQHTDWLFGMNGSRAIADRIYAGKDNKIAAGRVMTWVQTIIVDREDEIANFIPKTTYGVKVNYIKGFSGNLYEKNSLVEADKKADESAGQVFFETKEEAEKVIASLGNTGTVIDVQKTKQTIYAPKLYKLATIQMDGAKEGFSAAKTLEIVQSLYEKHYVSYPRTDCEVLSSNENFRAIIASSSAVPGFVTAANDSISKISEIIKNRKYVNDKELAKHGHSALVPTSLKPDFSILSSDEQIIFKLIAKRFLSIFQPPLIQEKVVILVDVDGKIFRSSGKTILDAGYTKFTGENVTSTTLPNVTNSEKLNISDKETVEKTTTCPKRFTDSTLIAAMENPTKYLTDKTIKDNISSLSIGTSATRGAVIEKLVKDKYILRKKGSFYPTDFGSFMIHKIRGISLCKIDTTGNWELTLTKVRQGEQSYESAKDFLTSQCEDLINEVKQINKVSFVTGDSWEKKVLMTCPGCGKDIMIGPINYYCLGYRDGCKYSTRKEFLGAKFSDEDVTTLFNGGVVEKELTKKDKSAKWIQKLKFNGVEGKLDFVQAVGEEIEVLCPDCRKNMYLAGNKLSCKNCNCTVWTKVAGTELSTEDVSYIFENGESKKTYSFTKKDGGKFNARLVLKREGGKTNGFGFKF